jgi:hypothetical protein
LRGIRIRIRHFPRSPTDPLTFVAIRSLFSPLLVCFCAFVYCARICPALHKRESKRIATWPGSKVDLPAFIPGVA